MSTPPLISILVPIYGVEKYIERCIISLFEQTYQNLEYIFVNDCTKDDSIDILKKIIKQYPNREHQVHIIHHDLNKGLACARNTALENATGDYIIHIDSDDYVSTEIVSKLVSKISDCDANIVDIGYNEVDCNYNVLQIVNPFKGATNIYFNLIISRCGWINNQIWGRLIKRELYTVRQIKNIEGVDMGEDYSVLPLLLYDCKRTIINEPLYCYRVDNSNSYMNTYSKKNLESLIKAHKHVYNKLSKEYLNRTNKFFLELGMLNFYKAYYTLYRKYGNDSIKYDLNEISFSFTILRVYKKMLLSKRFHKIGRYLGKIMTFITCYRGYIYKIGLRF